MGSFLDKPKTEKTNENGKGNGISYGVSAMQGWRIEMEDSHCSKIGLSRIGLENWSFFAVFDGHAGGTVSKTSSNELLTSILDADPELFNELASLYESNTSSLTKSLSNSSLSQQQQQQTQSSSSPTSSHITNSSSNTNNNDSPNHNETTNSTCNNLINNKDELTTNLIESNNTNTNTNSSNTTNDSNSNGSVCNNLNNSNNSISVNSNKNSLNNNNNNVCKYTEEQEKRLKNAIRKGFLDLDEKIRRMPEFDKGEDKSGSTAVACLISPTHIYLINCGDSRAMLVSDNKVILSTYDHKPINPNERERIQNAGGSVMIQRVNGSLAVSRALGDYEYKCVEGRGPCEQLVSPEPEIYSCERSYDKDEFVVLACDGIWDVMTNDELKTFIHSRFKVTDDLVKISNEVLDMCLNKGSRDNMSLIIVSFPAAPKIEPEEVEKDNSCNEKIENRIKELVQNSSSKIEFSQVLHTISEEKWDDFPPGGGLYAKQALIEEIYNRLSPRNNEDDSISSTHFLLNSSL